MESSNLYRQQQPDAAHKIDIICLAVIVSTSLDIQYVSLFSCLIRSDYNFVIIFFVYFLWQQKYSPLAPHIVLFFLLQSLAAVGVSIVFDILFAIVEIPAWTAFDVGNPVWQTLKGMHNFGIFCYVIILLLKLGLGYFLFKMTNKSGNQ